MTGQDLAGIDIDHKAEVIPAPPLHT
jgi:hypothetical protein